MATAFIRAGMPATACFVAIVFPAAFASASGPEGGREREPLTFTYRFDRHALATQQGARRTYRRLLQEARRACTAPGASLLATRATDGVCVAELVNQVVLRVDAELLTALHRQAAGNSRSPARE